MLPLKVVFLFTCLMLGLLIDPAVGNPPPPPSPPPPPGSFDPSKDLRFFYELSIIARGRKNNKCPDEEIMYIMNDLLVPAMESFDPVIDLHITNATNASIVSEEIALVNETVTNSTEVDDGARRLRGPPHMSRRRLYGEWFFSGGNRCRCCYCNECNDDEDFRSRGLQTTTSAPITTAPSASPAPSMFPSQSNVPSSAPSAPEATIRLRSDTVPKRAMKKLRRVLKAYIESMPDDFCMRGTTHVLMMEYVDPPSGKTGEDWGTNPPPPPPEA